MINDNGVKLKNIERGRLATLVDDHLSSGGEVEEVEITRCKKIGFSQRKLRLINTPFFAEGRIK